MDYTIEITKRLVSYYAEECSYKSEEGHNAEGTGPECNDHCMWLEGDSRELESPDHEEVTADADDLSEHDGDPVAWATQYLRPMASFEPSQSPVPDALGGHEWLTASEEDPYAGPGRRTTETTARLTGDWTPEQRASVFKAVTA